MVRLLNWRPNLRIKSRAVREIILLRGSDEDNAAYCSKQASRKVGPDSGPFEFGVRVPHAGKKGGRSDLLKLKKLVDEDTTELRMFDEAFPDMIRHYKAITHYRHLRFNVERRWETITILIVGPSDTQKTTLSEILWPYFGKSVYRMPETKGSGLYFDGYHGQEVVLWQDFDGGSCKFTTFKNLIQGTPTKVPVHGSGSIEWAPRYIIITSNYLPQYWWKSHQGSNDVAAIRKRIHAVFKRLHPRKPVNLCGFCIQKKICPFHHE